MNSQELRALQEAYSQVYELDESAIGDRARNAVADQRLDAAQRDTQQSVNKLTKREKVTRASAHIAAKKVEGDVRKSSAYGPQRPKPGTTGAYRITDSFDVYDVILSHLLDEGYADTEQAAQVIMVNMSENWRESIVEEVLDERKYEADEKLPGSGKTPNEKMWGAQGKHGAHYMSARGDVRFRGNPKNSSHSRGTKVGKIKDIIASGEDPRNSPQAGIGWGNDARKIGRPGDRPGDRIKKTNRTEDDDARSTHTQGGLRAHKTKAGGYRTLKKKEG